MSQDFLDTCMFLVKKPKDCSDEEINNFYELVQKGGKVSLEGLLRRIKNCELLAFCYFEEDLVAVSSIKKPGKNYVQNVINKSKIKRTWDELIFEIGYSFTEEEYRKKGISKTLKLYLLEAMKTRKGIIFSTTAIKSSQNFFSVNGFVQKGESYDGDNDKGIRYYEMEL